MCRNDKTIPCNVSSLVHVHDISFIFSCRAKDAREKVYMDKCLKERANAIIQKVSCFFIVHKLVLINMGGLTSL